jgi:hypothetical protein
VYSGQMLFDSRTLYTSEEYPCIQVVHRRFGSWDSSVGIATGWTARVRFQTVQEFSLLHVVHTGSGAHQAYLMGTGAVYTGVKRPGREADYSPPSSAEVMNGGAMPPLPHTSSWHST